MNIKINFNNIKKILGSKRKHTIFEDKEFKKEYDLQQELLKYGYAIEDMKDLGFEPTLEDLDDFLKIVGIHRNKLF